MVGRFQKKRIKWKVLHQISGGWAEPLELLARTSRARGGEALIWYPGVRFPGSSSQGAYGGRSA